MANCRRWFRWLNGVSMVRECCVVALAVLLLLSATCSLKLRSMDTSMGALPIQGIEDGVTTRTHLETSLGLPAASFEGGRVAVWSLDKRQRPGVLETRDIRFHLVAVFDERGIVERHSSLRIR